MKRNFTNIFIFIILTPLCFGQKIPSWYVDGKLNGYPSQKYFIGIGEGKNYQRALENAGLYIASQMQISISSKLESSVSETSLNGEISSSEFVKEDITTQVNQSLPALEIIKNEKVKKAFKPIPGAKATGQLAKKPIKRQAIKEARIVATKTESKSIPVSDKMAVALRLSSNEVDSTLDYDKLTIAPRYSITESLGAILEFSDIDIGTEDANLVAVELTYTF